jgi:NAD(P)-dependent dehydrogenase (short-subunit alcohol dehydrogenase family)
MKTMKTVLITGCSGYGLESARHFQAQGWNVVATVRTRAKTFCPARNGSACWHST